ncbi:hypothetical protein PPL_08502 [Heterostelium album PN500]|uniref:Uncharacterized protein n=1 Tax=Heterostelium pallidum (strain ATCC 26659 / Pp 5 / PN500) TaxID=670386 RepID=D3BID3_HETP5|nr:hypothetical protein PPL_08502 [Heterostelium album PN500]EFA79033.1 hypothetical protein PPL_08502 [Heterostelium album PN500]|eukprot:XP_020431156.1 hypothetical protein PPL_08502 [Heterostelium album PN500]
MTTTTFEYSRYLALCRDVTAYSGCTLTPSLSTTSALVMSVSSVVTPSLNSATHMSISSSNAGISVELMVLIKLLIIFLLAMLPAAVFVFCADGKTQSTGLTCSNYPQLRTLTLVNRLSFRSVTLPLLTFRSLSPHSLKDT